MGFELKPNTMTALNNPSAFVSTNLKLQNSEQNYVLEQVYVNYKPAPTSINAGIYKLVVTTDVNAVSLNEDLIVQKAPQNESAITITTAAISPDSLATSDEKMYADMMVKVTAATSAPKGNLYIGYRLATDGEEDPNAEYEYQWFPAVGNSYTFCLDYGQYVFAVQDSGNTNYARCTVETGVYTISPSPITLSDADKTQFTYTVGNSYGEVVWYDLPAMVNPSRVKLVYGVPASDGNGAIRWQSMQTSDCVYFGVVVLNSNYGGSSFNDLSNVLQLLTPVAITNVNNHQSSIMSGSALYFMGGKSGKASIDTYGNDIFLNTDMIVLTSGIAHTAGSDGEKIGRVVVEPYSPNDDTNYTLLYNPTNSIIIVGTANLAPDTFYKIEAGKDLCTLTDAYLLKNGRTLGDTGTLAVQHQFTLSNGAFPDINLDIAYATNTQLSRIVSSETVGWTNKGDLNGTNAGNNYSEYAVCTYVHNISAAANYTANRILLAAETSTGFKQLMVPKSVSFTVRYLSIDAEKIIQQNGSYFKVYNLAQNGGVLDYILNSLKLNAFSSKSLQVDFERFTVITPGAPNGITKQIYRYDNDTDFFTAAGHFQPLVITYTDEDIEDLFGSFTSGVAIVERYMSIKSSEGEGVLDISSMLSSNLAIYANYIHIDDSIKEIRLSSIYGGSYRDITISSQESGYNDREYLAYFKDNSPEKYKGTLVYFERERTHIIFSDEPITVTRGFYYIYATTNGTSLSALKEENLFKGNIRDNVDKKPYKIDSASLKDYAIYVDEDGNLSQAYVDTGLEGSGGMGGFSGGAVQ